MAWYRVLLEGKGITLPIEGEKPIIGFFATRVVRASSAEQAAVAATALVADLRSVGDYAESNKGQPPELHVDELERVNFWQAWRIPNKGHAFYSEDE